ncbi:MAG: hypothetical protein GF404_12630 [candidate division Zixibacteria bacterium]|nr:hypothetical protein [candidate division Zixibacteria bacterium]
MNRTERIAKLVKLVEKSPEGIKSRKKFHKLVYLLQETGEDFDQNYIFHNYGVFSPTLASDLDNAVERDVLSVSIEEKDFKEYIYTKGTEKICGESIEIEKMDLIKKLIFEEPRFLEVLSTIVYLDRFHYKGKELISKLKELKPKHKPYYDNALRMAKNLFQISVER